MNKNQISTHSTDTDTDTQTSEPSLNTTAQAKADIDLLKKLGSPSGTLYKMGYKYVRLLGKGGSGLVGLYKALPPKQVPLNENGNDNFKPGREIESGNGNGNNNGNDNDNENNNDNFKPGQEYAIKVTDLQARVQALATKTGKTVQSIRQTLLKYLNKEANIAQIINRELKSCGSDADYIMRYHSLDSPDPDYFFMLSEPMVADLSRLKTQNLTEDAIMAIICQLIYATACLHSIGLIHGDIKPSNIFLAEDGTIKLGDFGESAYINIRKSMPANFSLVTGMTPTYKAPEVLTQNRSPATKYDIWSLGVVILELLKPVTKPKFKLGGLKLMEQAEIDDVIKQIKLKNADLEAIIKELLEQFLQVDPNQRVELNELDVGTCKPATIAEDELKPAKASIAESETNSEQETTSELISEETLTKQQSIGDWFKDSLEAISVLPQKSLAWLRQRLR